MKSRLHKSVRDLIKYGDGIRLDIGCGANKQDGFVGLDIREMPNVDIVQDVEQFPWALPNECVRTALASHLVEHINPHKGVFMQFMDEVWRIMKPYGKFIIVTPYAGSFGYFQDPTHVNPCNEATWMYFAPEAENGALYDIYKPKPWRIEHCSYATSGNMETILVKLPEDPTFDKDSPESIARRQIRI